MKRILLGLAAFLLAGKVMASTPTNTQTFTFSPTATFTFSPTSTFTPTYTPTATPTMTVQAVYRDVFNAPGSGAVHFIPSSNYVANEAVDLGQFPGRYKMSVYALNPTLTLTPWVLVNKMDKFRPGYGVSSTANVGFTTNYVKVQMQSIFPIGRVTVVALSGWATYTSTASPTLTITPTATPTWTPTTSQTFTFSPTYTTTPTSTATRTPSPTPTNSPTPTLTWTVTPNATQTYIALVHAQQTAIAATLTATP